MKRIVAPFGDAAVRLRLIEARDLDATRAWRNRDDARIWFKSRALIDAAGHRAWFEQYLAKDDDFLFIVEHAGVPVGQAAVYGVDWIERRAEVGRFLVAPLEAGKGHLGQACASLVRFCALSFGLAELFLEVMEGNQRAIRMYRRCGFVEQGRRDGLIRMARALAAPEKS